MYRTATLDASLTVVPLGLSAIVYRAYPDGTTPVSSEAVVRHVSDLCAGYDVPYQPSAALGNTFTEMARDLVSSLDTQVDLVVVAHDTPDLDHRLAATTYLSEALPISALQFTVSEGGSCTPYTALRLASGYASRHGYQRVLVLLLDQGTLPYETGMPLSGDAGVALLLDRSCSPGLVLRQVTGVSAASVPDVLSDLLPSDGPLSVVAGAGINPGRDLPSHASVLWHAAAGAPCTASWAGVARHFGRAVVVVDYEPRTEELSVCVVDGS
ncbi:hypothetical protein GCM10029964_068160 [Kibdelosporangium lantanae]